MCDMQLWFKICLHQNEQMGSMRTRQYAVREPWWYDHTSSDGTAIHSSKVGKHHTGRRSLSTEALPLCNRACMAF